MDSARFTPAIRIRSQSASVFGWFSTSPCFFVIRMLTALNSGSALGLITSCISSFTDTKGLNSPQSSVFREGGAAVSDVDEGGGDAGFEDEQLDASSPKTPAAKAPTTTTARG